MGNGMGAHYPAHPVRALVAVVGMVVVAVVVVAMAKWIED